MRYYTIYEVFYVCSYELRIFCDEVKGASGGFFRRFVVATYCGIWRMLRHKRCGFRHMYEVLRQGWPCNLYFDVEYNKPANPDLKTNLLMGILLDLVDQELR